MIFPSTEVTLTCWQFPGSSFLSIITAVLSPFFCSPGTSPDCLDFSNTTESGSVTAAVNSLRALGLVSSGPKDSWMFESAGGCGVAALPSAVTTAWRCVALHGNSKEPESAFPGMPQSLALLAGNCLPSRWQQSCVAPEHFKDSTEMRGSSQQQQGTGICISWNALEPRFAGR
ncbi:gem-associated protein 7 isoform X1 [Lagopus muta]|uniref:gem-associated protein 7 isoform X1 n=1 Tax=Lagopus muta TaxID=64668 RepID=UPI00209C9F15|nr:gem-associated protein 7 isoform X1 [Lagopus muta]